MAEKFEGTCRKWVKENGQWVDKGRAYREVTQHDDGSITTYRSGTGIQATNKAGDVQISWGEYGRPVPKKV